MSSLPKIVTRGYRIDVLDDQTNQWRSLCQRVGQYAFGAGLVESGWQDEGFVVLGATSHEPRRHG
jgi:hypothetical protein